MTFSLAYFYYCGFHFFSIWQNSDYVVRMYVVVLQLLLHSPVRNLSGFTVVVWKSQLLGHASTTRVYTMRKGFRQDLCMWIFTQAAGKEANGFSISAPQFLHLTLLLLIYLRKSILKAETICNTFRYCILCKNIYTHYVSWENTQFQIYASCSFGMASRRVLTSVLYPATVLNRFTTKRTILFSSWNEIDLSILYWLRTYMIVILKKSLGLGYNRCDCISPFCMMYELPFYVTAYALCIL